MSDIVEAPGFRGTVIGTIGSTTIVRGTLHGSLTAHIAETNELVVVLSGSVVVQVNGDCEALASGDCKLIPKGSEHRVRAVAPLSY